MSRETLINDIGEWLIDQVLSEPDIIDMFQQVCARLYGVGVPLSRARLTWPTLHPLFQAETILWRKDAEIEFEQFRHQEEASDEWRRSPMFYALENGLDMLRRNLDGPNKMLDFPILEDLVEQGHTDYLLIATSFSMSKVRNTQQESGLLVTWSSDRPGGFSDDDIAALSTIQRRFAAACKTAVQRRISRNIAETYLGGYAGSQVLEGAIKLGDGNETKAVVWYADMRRSTALADTMLPADFLELLNDYFSCTAGPAIEFGGEVLDFIGDAVLAIFPFAEESGKTQAIQCATMAMEKALELLAEVNENREKAGKVTIDFGLGINVGTFMFGNIGVASRLAFSVIGPNINEVERIEALTKVLEAKALVTQEIAAQDPENWVSVGEQQLAGVAHKRELFRLKQSADQPTEKPSKMLEDTDLSARNQMTH